MPEKRSKLKTDSGKQETEEMETEASETEAEKKTKAPSQASGREGKPGTNTGRSSKALPKEPWHSPAQHRAEDNTSALLRLLTSSVRSAKSVTELVLPQVEDEELRKMLNGDVKEYNAFLNKIAEIAEKCDTEVGGAGMIERFIHDSNIRFKLFFNSETTKIAEILIMEKTAGVIDLGRGMKHIGPACKESLELAAELLDFEEDNIDRIKYYL